MGKVEEKNRSENLSPAKSRELAITRSVSFLDRKIEHVLSVIEKDYKLAKRENEKREKKDRILLDTLSYGILPISYTKYTVEVNGVESIQTIPPDEIFEASSQYKNFFSNILKFAWQPDKDYTGPYTNEDGDFNPWIYSDESALFLIIPMTYAGTYRAYQNSFGGQDDISSGGPGGE